MEAMDESAFERELEHRVTKEKETKRWSEIKAEAEKSNIATPRYASSSRQGYDGGTHMLADNRDAASQNLLDTRPKSNLIEAIKQEIMQDEEFRKRLLEEVQPLLQPQPANIDYNES